MKEKMPKLKKVGMGKKQSFSSRMDESLGMRRGKESEKKESYAERRRESRGMRGK